MFMHKFCVIGNPVAHSLSPSIHAEFAEEAKLAIRYTKIHTERDQFKRCVEHFRAEGGHGLNITHPFKQQAYTLATQLTERAQLAKSVNTFLFQENGEILGDNTDGIGFINDVTKNLQYSLAEKRILILGAGGAVRGILHPILTQAPSELIIANRTVEKAKQLADEFSCFKKISVCALDTIQYLAVDVVIDGTAASANLSLPEKFLLPEKSLCYDLKYHGTPTAFMQWAKKNRASFISEGLGMLIEQAAEAFCLWTNYRPLTSPLKIMQLKNNLMPP